MTRRTRAVAIVGLLVICAGAALALLPSLLDMVEKRTSLHPETGETIYKVVISDSLTVRVSSEATRIGPDLFTGMALVAVATAAAMTALLVHAAGGSRRLRSFYALVAAGLAFLALDELCGVHETAGHNMSFLRDLLGVRRPDDVLFGLYLVPAAIFVVCFRDVILGSPVAFKLFLLGFAAFALAGASDIAELPFEEPLEIVVAIAMVGGLVTLMARHLRMALRLPGTRPEAGALTAAASE